MLHASLKSASEQVAGHTGLFPVVSAGLARVSSNVCWAGWSVHWADWIWSGVYWAGWSVH